MIDVVRETWVGACETSEGVERDVANHDADIERKERERYRQESVGGKHTDHHYGGIFEEDDPHDD